MEIKLRDYQEKKKRNKHGFTGTRIYRAWRNMKSRCYNPKASKYYLYGGKGIKVCDDWKNDFMSFCNWAMENGYKDDLTLDRINSDKGYCPENCRWATYKEQNSHLKFTDKKNLFKKKLITYKNETHCLKEWAKIKNLKEKTLLARYERGWSIERMLETPTIKEVKRGDDGRWKSS